MTELINSAIFSALKDNVELSQLKFQDNIDLESLGTEMGFTLGYLVGVLVTMFNVKDQDPEAYKQMLELFKKPVESTV